MEGATEQRTTLSIRAQWWWLLALAGFAARVILAFASDGSNDVRIWTAFASFIRDDGLTAAYQTITGQGAFDRHTGVILPVFNSPPLPALYMAGAQWFSDLLGIRFSLLIKVPGLCGEVLTAWVLARMFRADPERAAMTVAAYSWSLCSILVSGFHGNTDSAYAGLMLLGVYLLQERRQPFWAGVALAGAVNVKLIPLVIILPMLITIKNSATLARLVAGLAVGVLPFLIPLASAPASFLGNVVGYTPNPDYWGLEGLALSTNANPRWAASAAEFYQFYLTGYRPFLFGAILLVAILERLRPRLDEYARAALYMSIFLVLTPGFGVQYTVAAAPLIFAVSVAWGLRYATTAGLMILTVYLSYLTTGPLLNSQLTGLFRFPAPMIGMLAWGVLVWFIVSLLRQRQRR